MFLDVLRCAGVDDVDWELGFKELQAVVDFIGDIDDVFHVELNDEIDSIK